MVRSIAHVSDLHLGRDRRTDAAARRVCTALVEARVDAVLVTGDVTYRGRRAELLAFEEAFEPLLSRGHGLLRREVNWRGSRLRVLAGTRVALPEQPGAHEAPAALGT